MAEKFKGELSWIDPDKLITADSYNKTEGFFLSLGVVFNDLKGIILFEKMLMDHYERPKNGEVTSHVGNYSGTMVQIKKLIASTINEFFIFLKKNSDVFSESEFKQIFNRLSKSDRQLWEAMVSASHGRLPNVTNLLNSIVQIRNNIAYHYYQSGKALRNGYISRFFGKIKDDRNKFAYYSIGDSLEATRFYFSDAAVEESLYIAAGKRPEENIIGDVSLEKYHEQVIETIKVMNVAIASLLKNYIQSRRNRPK